MLQFGSAQLVLLLLVVVRTAGVMLIAPVFGTNEVPPTVRGLLAFTIALLMMPVQLGSAPALPPSIIDLGLMLAAETIIGVTLGLGVMILFSAFQLAGLVIGQLSGMSLGDVFNPGFDDNVPLFSQFLYLVTLAAYLLIGGHRMLMAGLLDTFQAIPAGTALVPSEPQRLFVDLISESFELGFRTAAPATVALLLATIVLGLVSRSLPQLNILALGFGLNALVTFGILGVTLGGACYLLQDHLEPTIEAILQTMSNAPN